MDSFPKKGDDRIIEVLQILRDLGVFVDIETREERHLVKRVARVEWQTHSAEAFLLKAGAAS